MDIKNEGLKVYSVDDTWTLRDYALDDQRTVEEEFKEKFGKKVCEDAVERSASRCKRGLQDFLDRGDLFAEIDRMLLMCPNLPLHRIDFWLISEVLGAIYQLLFYLTKEFDGLIEINKKFDLLGNSEYNDHKNICEP